MNEMKGKKYILLALIVTIVFGLAYISYLSKVKNPLVVIQGAINIELKDTIEVIDKNPLTLMGKESTHIINYMEDLGYNFEVQEGSGFFFKKDNENVLITSKKFTKRYIIWKIRE